MTIASAMHAAAPSHAPVTTFSSPADGDGGATAPFASQLHGLTDAEDDSGEQTNSNLPKSPARGTATHTTVPVQQPATGLPSAAGATSLLQPAVLAVAIALPRPAAKPLDGARPAQTTPSKRASANPTEDPKASEELNLAATVVVAPVVIPPEIVPTSTAPGDDSDGDANPALGEKAVAPPEPLQEAPAAAPPAVSESTATAQPAPEMAFAARVQQTSSGDRSTLPAEMASASAVASANKKVDAPAGSDAAAPADPHAVVAATAPVDRGTATVSAPAPAAGHSATAAHRTEAPVAAANENISKPAAPLKDISLQVNQPGKERVEVRVVQQGAEVRVSVHSGDAVLNSGLRQGLSDLQSRLEETGFRSEMWRPGVSTAPVAAANSAQASTNHSRGGEGQPQHGGSQQQDGGRRNQNQSNQPRWVEEMESSLGAGIRPTGGFYGFGS